METVKQTKEEYPIKNEVNIIELTELEMEKIDLVRKLNEGYLQINNEFGRISAQALAKEVELSVVQDNLESLKKQTKQAYSDFLSTRQKFQTINIHYVTV